MLGHLVRAGVAALALTPALAQTNLSVAPAPIPFLTLPAAAIVRPAVTSVSFTWTKSPDVAVTGYYLNHRLTSLSQFVRSAVGDTNFGTITNLIVGSNYVFQCTARIGTNEVSPPSNLINLTVPPPPQPMLTIRPYSYAIETYGYPGVNNLLQVSTNLKNWSTAALFSSKTGVLFRYVEVSTNQARFFRVTSP